MATTSKSPRAVLLAALAAAQRSLPRYSHRCSPKKFTQHQLFACLVLKSFLKTDYRGIVAHLADCPSLVEALGLNEVPHYTTLQKAAGRHLASTPARRLLDATVRPQAKSASHRDRFHGPGKHGCQRALSPTHAIAVRQRCLP